MAAEQATLYKIEPSYDSTVAVEVSKSGLLRKRKHVLVFEQFNGRLEYVPEHPPSSRVEITVEASSVTCRDKWLKARKLKHVAGFARSQVLLADQYPQIRFVSSAISAKPLRGFVVEGRLLLRGVERGVRANIILGPQNHGRFQIDADASIRLSDFGIKPPSSLFGLIGTRDEVMVHLLVWASQAS